MPFEANVIPVQGLSEEPLKRTLGPRYIEWTDMACDRKESDIFIGKIQL